MASRLCQDLVSCIYKISLYLHCFNQVTHISIVDFGCKTARFCVGEGKLHALPELGCFKQLFKLWQGLCVSFLQGVQVALSSAMLSQVSNCGIPFSHPLALSLHKPSPEYCLSSWPWRQVRHQLWLEKERGPHTFLQAGTRLSLRAPTNLS